MLLGGDVDSNSAPTLVRSCGFQTPAVSCALWKRLSQRWSDDDCTSRSQNHLELQPEWVRSAFASLALTVHLMKRKRRSRGFKSAAGIHQRWLSGHGFSFFFFFTEWICQAAFVDGVIRQNSWIWRGRQSLQVWQTGWCVWDRRRGLSVCLKYHVKSCRRMASVLKIKH